MADACPSEDRPAGRPLKPPNRKRFEEEIESLNTIVKLKDEELKSLDVRPQEKISSDVRKLQVERQQSDHKRRSVIGDMRRISEDIKKQLEPELTKIQSNLRSRSEQATDEMIQRLETQLKMNNYPLSEERKIVSEIDALKRSKKDLTAYQTLKKQIDEKRDQLKKLREERDCLQKVVNEIKSSEETILQENRSKWEKAVLVKKELDELHKKMRELQIDFNEQEKFYRQQKETQRRKQVASVQLRREEDRRAHEEAARQEMEELEASRGHFLEEKFLCKMLIQYLHRYLVTEDDSERTTGDSLRDSYDSKIDLLNESFKGEGKFLLRRKSDAEECRSAKQNSKTKKNKKRQSSIKKQIVHTPEIFQQFAELQLAAPASFSEIASSIEQLQEKLVFYEKSASGEDLRLCIQQSLPTEPQPHSSITSASYWFTHKDSFTSSVNSYTESTVSGSIPTTPEVQLDASKSLKVDLHCRRESKDSGTIDASDTDEQVVGFDIGSPEQHNFVAAKAILSGSSRNFVNFRGDECTWRKPEESSVSLAVENSADDVTSEVRKLAAHDIADDMPGDLEPRSATDAVALELYSL